MSPHVTHDEFRQFGEQLIAEIRGGFEKVSTDIEQLRVNVNQKIDDMSA